MPMKRLLLIPLVISLGMPVAAEEYKIRFEGGGNAYWTGAGNKYAVVKRLGGDKWFIRQTTLVSNMLTGFGKWWDHDVTASRACLSTDDGWGSTTECVVGEEGFLALPKGSNIRDYVIEIKWMEDGGEQYTKFRITNPAKKSEIDSESKERSSFKID